ncbi:MAG: hypothetical protein EOP09_00245 [Proteobacteria bacterium]|nr:MAG: hypothetical protein EOP09_00245 [Pseudomonadota bacterium]
MIKNECIAIVTRVCGHKCHLEASFTGSAIDEAKAKAEALADILRDRKDLADDVYYFVVPFTAAKAS